MVWNRKEIIVIRQIAICVCVLLLVVCGCKHRSKAAPADASVPATQKSTHKACCVICVGHEIDVDANTPTVEYKGKRYYFCSEECKAMFNEHPDKAIALFEAEKKGNPQGR